MLVKRSILLVKEESSYGSDPTPSATDNALLAIDAKIKETSEAIERKVQMATLSQKASLLGLIYSEVSFKVELKGSGTKGTAARIGDLLEACGFAETVSAGSSVLYKPASSSIKSVTLYLYIDGMLHKVLGARGNVKLSCPAGQIAMLEFSMKGLWVTPTDTDLPTATYETTVPPIVKSGNLSLNGVTSLVTQQVELDMGNEVSHRQSVSAATGIAGIDIVGRKPIITINPESVLVATYDFRTDLLTNPRALSLVIGSANGNNVTLSVPKYNITDIEYGEREGLLINTLKGEATVNSDAGDDELSLNFE